MSTELNIKDPTQNDALLAEPIENCEVNPQSVDPLPADHAPLSSPVPDDDPLPSYVPDDDPLPSPGLLSSPVPEDDSWVSDDDQSPFPVPDDDSGPDDDPRSSHVPDDDPWSSDYDPWSSDDDSLSSDDDSLSSGVPEEAVDLVIQDPDPVTISLSNLKTQCLTASCRLNPKSVQENWDHNGAEKMAYYEGVPLKALRLVEMWYEIKDADHRPCLWGCKDANGNPELLSGTYETLSPMFLVLLPFCFV